MELYFPSRQTQTGTSLIHSKIFSPGARSHKLTGLCPRYLAQLRCLRSRQPGSTNQESGVEFGVINRLASIIAVAIIIVIMNNTGMDSGACQNVTRCLTGGHAITAVPSLWLRIPLLWIPWIPRIPWIPVRLCLCGNVIDCE